MIRQLLIETVLLFAAGGSAGLAVALWSRGLLAKTMASYLEDTVVAVDGRVFVFGLLVALAAGLIFGLAPARQVAKVDLNNALRDSPRAAGGLSCQHVHSSLVIMEMALALVLLISFGLLFRSLPDVTAAPLGFDPSHLVTISAGLDQLRYSAPAARISLAKNVLEKTSKVPGVQSAAITDSLPLQGADGMWFVIQGWTTSQGQQATLRTVAVTPGFPPDLEDPVSARPNVYRRRFRRCAGRGRSQPDSGPPFLSRREPSGKTPADEDSPDVWREIVGVTADVRQRNLDEDSAPMSYRPWNQAPPNNLSLAVRVASSDEGIVASRVRSQLRSVDKSQRWEQPETMDQLIYGSESVSLRRPVVRLLGIFCILAALVAAVGLYGVISYSVTQRAQEIGVRVALAADRNAILGLVFERTAWLAGTGIALGIAASLFITRLLPAGPIGWTGAAIHLYGISRTDLLTYTSFSLLLAAIAIIASYVPARRATKVDPMVSLRHE